MFGVFDELDKFLFEGVLPKLVGAGSSILWRNLVVVDVFPKRIRIFLGRKNIRRH